MAWESFGQEADGFVAAMSTPMRVTGTSHECFLSNTHDK